MDLSFLLRQMINLLFHKTSRPWRQILSKIKCQKNQVSQHLHWLQKMDQTEGEETEDCMHLSDSKKAFHTSKPPRHLFRTERAQNNWKAADCANLFLLFRKGRQFRQTWRGWTFVGRFICVAWCLHRSNSYTERIFRATSNTEPMKPYHPAIICMESSLKRYRSRRTESISWECRTMLLCKIQRDLGSKVRLSWKCNFQSAVR